MHASSVVLENFHVDTHPMIKSVTGCLHSYFSWYRTNLMKLRSDYKDAFFEKHGVKLGLMSGFVKVWYMCDICSSTLN